MLCSNQLLILVVFLVGLFVSLSDVVIAQATSQGSTRPKRTFASIFQVASSNQNDGSVNVPSPITSDSPASPAPIVANPALDPLKDNEPEFLQTLPRPPEQPASLMTPAPQLGGPAWDLEQPYVMHGDHLLDPPEWGQVGWFCDVQVAPVVAHVSNQMAEYVQPSGNLVRLGASSLNWTVSPRVELGYRLGGGLGEFAISDTTLSTTGSRSIMGPDGQATQATSFTFNYTDVDYISREYAPFQNWEMKWRLGLRIAESYTSTSVTQPYAQAAAGTGIYGQQQSNGTIGYGPHWGVELTRTFPDTGFSLVGKLDSGDQYTMITQKFYQQTTTGNSSQIDSFPNQTIQLNAQLGVAWTPRNNPYQRVYIGYIEETWWDFMTNVNNYSQGTFYYQGVVVRASFNY